MVLRRADAFLASGNLLRRRRRGLPAARIVLALGAHASSRAPGLRGPGHWGNVNDAEARVVQFHAVLTDLQSIARQRQNQSIALPDPESWAPVFYARFPLLEWGGESTPRGVTHLFGDMLAASLVDNLSTQLIPIKRLTPSDRAFLTRIPWLAPLPNPNPDSSRR